MSLTNDVISQFVKVTRDQTVEKNENTVFGTISVYNGSNYVKLDGSELLTPVSSTANVVDGERVTVLIKNHSAIVTGNLSSPSVRNEELVDLSNSVTTKFDAIEANYVKTETLFAEDGHITNLEADVVEINKSLTANSAKIGTLEADNVTINETLTAQDADIVKLWAEKATVVDLEAAQAKIGILEVNVSDIDTLIFGSASGTTIQTSFANAVIAQLGNAQIKSAMIENVSADKINAGDIITNNVRVMSEDGSLVISDETIQIKDDARVRVQIGKDAAGDYSINIWDADGKLMFSEGGITDSAIKDAIIRNDMVADDANISAKKLDISSLITEINDGSETIKSSKIYMDADNQTLDVSFVNMTDDISDLSDTVTTHGTSISAIQGQISSKIWQQDIDAVQEEVTELSTKQSTLDQTVDSLSAKVSDNTTKINNKADSSTVTTVSNKVAELELEIDNFKVTVGDTYVTESEFKNLEIGGRNYFSAKSECEFDANNEYTLADYQDVGSFSQFYNLTVPMGTFVGKTCTLSFECISPNGSTPIDVYNRNRAPRYLINVSGIISPISDSWTKQELTITVIDQGDNESYSESTSDKIEFYCPEQLGCKIRNVKFEIGTRATDWTPAPEDVRTDIDRLDGNMQSQSSMITSLQMTADSISSSVERIETNIETTAGELSEHIATLSKQVETKMSAEDVQVQINSSLDKGVSKVVTSTGFTFDQNGLTVEKSDSEMKTQISEDGMVVYKNDEAFLTANNNGVDAVNLHASTYLIIGNNSRFEDWGERTACFWIG